MNKQYFESMKNKIKEFSEKMKTEGKQFFLDQSKELFENNKNLDSFGWNQYTPYYNDGESCTFSANTDYPFVNIVGEENQDEDSWYKDDDNSPQAITWRNVKSFLNQFSDTDLEMMFGDHVSIRVTEKEVLVEEYEHD